MVTSAEMIARAAERVAEEENARWHFLRGLISDGFDAAALITTDPDTLAVDVLINESVEVCVLVAGEESEAVEHVPLLDLWRLVTAGVDVVDVKASIAAGQSIIGYQAVAVASAGDTTYSALVCDRRGLGHLAHSQAPGPKPGQTFGQWFLPYAQRSGVQDVNERRREAAQEIYRQNPSGFAKGAALVDGRMLVEQIVATEVVSWSLTSPPGAMSEWGVFAEGSALSLSPTTARLPSLPDRIVDALSIEAYGAKRPHHGGARVRQASMSLEALTNVVDGQGQDWDREVIPRRLKHPEVSDWTLWQSSRDPTGELAARIARIEDAERVLIQELMTYGRLTERQAQCYSLSAKGYSGREIAAKLDIDPSRVSRHLRDAQAKLEEVDNT